MEKRMDNNMNAGSFIGRDTQSLGFSIAFGNGQ